MLFHPSHCVPELIGEEILDEFDLTGPQAASRYVPPSAKRAAEEQYRHSHPTAYAIPAPTPLPLPTPAVWGASGLPTLQFPKVASSLNIFSRSRSQPGTPRVGPHQLPTADKDTEPWNGFSDIYAGGPYADRDPEGTDGSTLRATLTSDTGTTADVSALPTRRAPEILVSDEHGVAASVSVPPTPASSLAPGVTEAILQAQTRRRAQLQQQAHSASSIVLPAGSATLSTLGELQLPVPRQVSKGRFKSSPLTAVALQADKEDRGDAKEKVPGSDPNLAEPKDGL